MLQQTPRAVTAAPPLPVILPPLVAVDEVVADTAVVVSMDNTAVVVVITSFPYAVPILLVA